MYIPVYIITITEDFFLLAAKWTMPEKAMAPHSGTFAWKIPWMEEPGGLQSMGLRRVGHDWMTSLWLFTFMHWRRKWQPTPVFLPGESQGRGSLVAAVYGVTQSHTRLKWLSSSSSICSGRVLLPNTLKGYPFLSTEFLFFCTNSEIHIQSISCVLCLLNVLFILYWNIVD